MKSDYIVYGILAIVFGIVIYTIYSLTAGSAAIPEETKNLNTAFATVTSGNTETGSVQIDLTPVGYQNGQLKVDIAVNTHSVELSQYGLAKITILEYDGKRINPISVPSLSGHHSSGTLIFNVDKDIKAFKITISGIPGIQERVFEWK